MVWTLFKKDLTAMLSGFLFSRKTGKKRSVGSIIAYIVLFALQGSLYRSCHKTPCRCERDVPRI